MNRPNRKGPPNRLTRAPSVRRRRELTLGKFAGSLLRLHPLYSLTHSHIQHLCIRDIYTKMQNYPHRVKPSVISPTFFETMIGMPKNHQNFGHAPVHKHLTFTNHRFTLFSMMGEFQYIEKLRSLGLGTYAYFIGCFSHHCRPWSWESMLNEIRTRRFAVFDFPIFTRFLRSSTYAIV